MAWQTKNTVTWFKQLVNALWDDTAATWDSLVIAWDAYDGTWKTKNTGTWYTKN
jgi:hypothetical protein